jgi:TonB family protein
MHIARSQFLSLTLHLLSALLLVLISRAIRAPLQTATPIHTTPLTFFHTRIADQSRGGGSNRTPLPARHGSPPPRALRTFIPPVANPHPRLALPITIVFDIPLEPSSSAQIGDPLSRLPNGALGMIGANGIGDRGCCGGIGDSQSGVPGLSVRRGEGVTPPQLLHKVEPEFSEEARKAKHQGMVVLSIIVDASGTVRNIRVLQGLGMGLDEKAVDAVSRWRFRAGLFDGKPVATEATVQVRFQLL